MLTYDEAPRASNPDLSSASPQGTPRPTGPTDGGAAVTTTTTSASGEPIERFFPIFFGLLAQAVTTAIPHIVEAFRAENQLRDVANRQPPEAIERFLPQLLSVVGPVLSEMVPVLVKQIQNAIQQRSISRGISADNRTLEEILPIVLGGIVPPIINSLPPVLAGMFGGLVGGGRDFNVPLPRLVDAEVSSRYVGPILEAFLTAVSSNLPILVSLINGVSRSPSQPRDIGVSWSDFTDTNRFWDNDVISVRLEPIDDPNSIEIVLELAAHKTYWKGIQAQDDNGTVVTEIWVQDNKKTDSMRLDARVLLDAGGYLLFMKGKMFNIHTGMYRLATGGLNQLRGQRATFFWSAD